MKDFYIDKITHLIRGNKEIYEDVSNEILFCVPDKEQLADFEKDLLLEVFLQMREKITLKNSPFDLTRLTRAIQNSRSGMGGAALTSFECKFCGTHEVWSNTATPGICHNCAEKMALNIIRHNSRILKEGGN